MKFNKKDTGRYVSENGRFEICKYAGQWEVYDNEKECPVYRASRIVRYTRAYIGHKETLKEAKELCE